jgi:hypothetical protein
MRGNAGKRIHRGSRVQLNRLFQDNEAHQSQSAFSVAAVIAWLSTHRVVPNDPARLRGMGFSRI